MATSAASTTSVPPVLPSAPPTPANPPVPNPNAAAKTAAAAAPVVNNPKPPSCCTRCCKRVWSVITCPFRAVGSLISSICAKIYNAVIDILNACYNCCEDPFGDDTAPQQNKERGEDNLDLFKAIESNLYNYQKIEKELQGLEKELPKKLQGLDKATIKEAEKIKKEIDDFTSKKRLVASNFEKWRKDVVRLNEKITKDFEELEKETKQLEQEKTKPNLSAEDQEKLKESGNKKDRFEKHLSVAQEKMNTFCARQQDFINPKQNPPAASAPDFQAQFAEAVKKNSKQWNDELSGLQKKVESDLDKLSKEIRSGAKKEISLKDLETYQNYLSEYEVVDSLKIVGKEVETAHLRLKNMGEVLRLPLADHYQFVNGNVGPGNLRNSCWLDSLLEALTPLFADPDFESGKPYVVVNPKDLAATKKDREKLEKLGSLIRTAMREKSTGNQEKMDKARDALADFLNQNKDLVDWNYSHNGCNDPTMLLMYAFLAQGSRFTQSCVRKYRLTDSQKNHPDFAPAVLEKEDGLKKYSVVSNDFLVQEDTSAGTTIQLTFPPSSNGSVPFETMLTNYHDSDHNAHFNFKKDHHFTQFTEINSIQLDARGNYPRYIAVTFKRNELRQQPAPIEDSMNLTKVASLITGNVGTELLQPSFGRSLAIAEFLKANIKDNSIIFGTKVQDLTNDRQGKELLKQIDECMRGINLNSDVVEEAFEKWFMSGNNRVKIITDGNSLRLVNLIDFLKSNATQLHKYTYEKEESIRMNMLIRNVAENASQISQIMGSNPSKPKTETVKIETKVGLPADLRLKLNVFKKETNNVLVDVDPAMYDVVAFQVHDSNHYIGYRKGMDGNWRKCNDTLWSSGKGTPEVITADQAAQEAQNAYTMILRHVPKPAPAAAPQAPAAAVPASNSAPATATA